MRSRDLVRMARDRAGLSQEQLAARTGKPRSTIARWESGTRTPPLESVEDLVAGCGLQLIVGIGDARQTVCEPEVLSRTA